MDFRDPAELRQLRVDRRSFVEVRQDTDRRLTGGKLGADPLTVTIAQPQALVVQ